MAAFSAHAAIGVPEYPQFVAPWASVIVTHPDANANINHTGSYFIDALKGPHFTLDGNASWSVDEHDDSRVVMMPKVLGKHGFIEEIEVASGGQACRFSILYDTVRVRLGASTVGKARADCSYSLNVEGFHHAIRFSMR